MNLQKHIFLLCLCFYCSIFNTWGQQNNPFPLVFDYPYDPITREWMSPQHISKSEFKYLERNYTTDTSKYYATLYNSDGSFFKTLPIPKILLTRTFTRQVCDSRGCYNSSYDSTFFASPYSIYWVYRTVFNLDNDIEYAVSYNYNIQIIANEKGEIIYQERDGEFRGLVKTDNGLQLIVERGYDPVKRYIHYKLPGDFDYLKGVQNNFSSFNSSDYYKKIE